MRIEAALDRLERRDEAAVLQVSRRVTELLLTYGAYTVRRDWSETTRDIFNRQRIKLMRRNK